MSYFPSELRTITVPVTNVLISGAQADRAQVTLPVGINAWIPRSIHTYLTSTGGSGSMTATSIEIWTTGNVGAGVSLLPSTPVTMSSFSTVNAYQFITGVQPTTVFTASGILVKQNGGAAGTASGRAYFGIVIDVLN